MNSKLSFRPLLLTLAGISVFTLSFSQGNYKAGYLVTLKGDTVRGFVDYRHWESNPNRILFGEQEGGDHKSYSPLAIRGFGIPGELYESAIVQTEIGSAAELQFKNDTTFLLVMMRGSKSLFYYKNSAEIERFYIEGDRTYDLLIHKTYQKNKNGSTVTVENKKYAGQLALYLQSCSSIQSNMSGLTYTKMSLEKLFDAYYECTYSSARYKKRTDRTLAETGAIVGLSYSDIKCKKKKTR